jgi:Recombination endonuclease VII
MFDRKKWLIEWKKKHPERARQIHLDAERKYRWKVRGICFTKEEYGKLFTKQKGNCAICERNQSNFKFHLAVEHCHKTGKIRGLVCSSCNLKISVLEDKEICSKILNYLQGIK